MKRLFVWLAIPGLIMCGMVLSACVAFTDYPELTLVFEVPLQSRSHFLQTVTQFGQTGHFSDTRPSTPLGNTTYVRLGRYNMDIIISNDADVESGASEYQVSVYDGLLFHSGKDRIDRTADNFSKITLMDQNVRLLRREPAEHARRY